MSKTPRAEWFDALVVIEDDIPLTNMSSPFYEQVRTMQVGQSFLFPYTRKPICGNLARATGFKFSQRRVSPDHMRIWRIE